MITRGMRVRISAAAALFAACAAVMLSACSDPVVPAAPTPVAPTITKTFTGTLLQGGANSHPFAVQQIGGIRVSITKITPSAAVSLGVGTPSTASGVCLAIQNLTAVASEGTQISGT